MEKQSVLYWVLATAFLLVLGVGIYYAVRRGGGMEGFTAAAIASGRAFPEDAMRAIDGIVAQHVERLRPHFADATHVTGLQTAFRTRNWANAITHVQALRAAADGLAPSAAAAEGLQFHLRMLEAELALLVAVQAPATPGGAHTLAPSAHATAVQRCRDRVANLKTATDAINVETQARWTAELPTATRDACAALPSDCAALWTEYAVVRSSLEPAGALAAQLASDPPNYAQAFRSAAFARHVLEVVASGEARNRALPIALALEAELGVLSFST